MMKGVRYGTNETGEKRLLVGSQLQQIARQMPLTFILCEHTLGSRCDPKVSLVAPIGCYRRHRAVSMDPGERRRCRGCSWHPGAWPDTAPGILRGGA